MSVVLTQEYLKERLHYDPITGFFVWRPCAYRSNSWNASFANKLARTIRTKPCGYRSVYIGLDYKRYIAARLAWLYMLGRWPVVEVDHINRDSTDDRWINLREVTHAENLRNRTKFSWKKRPDAAIVQETLNVEI